MKAERGTKTMFAVIKTGGKQYRVAEDQIIKIERIKAELGEIIQLSEVLMLGGEKLEVGAPMVAGASVAGEVIEQGRNAKVIAFKKRRRKNSRRKRGHRQEFTLLRITEILTEGAKPTKGPQPKPERKVKPVEVQDGDVGDDTPKAKKKPAKKAKPALKAKSKAAAKGKKK